MNEWVIKAPAIAMMVVSGMNLVSMVPYFLMMAFQGAAHGPAPGREDAMIAFYVFILAVVLAGVAYYGVMFFGAWKMFRMESWGLALTAAILMVVPCTCFWVGLPVGIWAIVVLSLNDVRSAFD